MVDRVIRVIVDPSGARSGFQGIKSSADSTNQALGTLKRTAAAVIVALGVRELNDYSDTWVNINNRIKLVTDTTDEQVRIQRELLTLANDTRTPLEATVELYSRMARSTEELGISQQSVLDITKTVNQAIQISGATSQEAAAGVIQFAQGLGSGALRGDELRSVLETTPRLARALAEGLGVGVGKLRELGAEGKLTAKSVVEALQKTAPEIAAEFELITPTIEQAFSVLGNEILTTIGQLNDVTGAGNAFSETLTDISSYLHDNRQNILLFGLALKQSITEGFTEASAVIKIAQADVTTYIAKMANAANEVKDFFGLADERDLRISRAVVAEAEANAKRVTEVAVAQAKVALDEIQKAGDTSLQRILSNKPSQIDLTKPRGKDVTEAAPDKEAEKLQTRADKLLETLQKQTAELALQNEFGDIGEAIMRRSVISELEQLGVSEKIVTALRDTSDELERQQKIERDLATLKADNDVIKQYERQLELLQAEGDERYRILAIQALSVDATAEQIKQTQELVKQIDKAEKSQQLQLITLEEIDKQFVQGVGQSLNSFFKNLDQGFDGIRQSFADLLQNLAADILTNIIITQFFKSLGGGSGNLFTSIFSGLIGNQFGGDVSANRPVIVGEANRPEIFIPSQAGRIEPLDNVLGGQQQVVVINEQDPAALLSILSTHRGVRVQRNFVTTNTRQIKRELGVR